MTIKLWFKSRQDASPRGETSCRFICIILLSAILSSAGRKYPYLDAEHEQRRYEEPRHEDVLRRCEPDDIRRDSTHVERAEKMPPAASEEFRYHSMSLPFVDGSIIAARFSAVYDISMIGVFLMIIGDLYRTGGAGVAEEGRTKRQLITRSRVTRVRLALSARTPPNPSTPRISHPVALIPPC